MSERVVLVAVWMVVPRQVFVSVVLDTLIA